VTERIQVAGLRELRKALKSMSADLPKQIRVALNEASMLVIDYAQGRGSTSAARVARKAGHRPGRSSRVDGTCIRASSRTVTRSRPP
jgi:hypothetical protein